MCGLLGYSGDKKPNLAKLKILGMHNVTRGRDSCGIFYNNSLIKGIGSNKAFDDFIEDVIIEDVDEPDQNIFIGHTRWSTVGAHTAANAHPFLLNENQIFAHNGTISNIDDLLKKYGVSKEEHHIEVDSQGLGILLGLRGHSILEEYRGYAAFLTHYKKEKNTLWVFKGSSKEYGYQHSPVVEERPLFYARHREGIYLSSMPESLKAIRDGQGQDPIPVPTNKLIKIVGSEFAVEEYDVNREGCNIGIKEKKSTAVYPPSSSQNGNRNSLWPTKTTTETSCGHNATVGRCLNQGALPFNLDKSVRQVNERLQIAYETYPPKCFDKKFAESELDFVFWWKGRYWHGNDELCEGKLLINKDGFVSSKDGWGFYETYFHRGVMLDGVNTYLMIMDAIDKRTDLGVKLSDPAYNFAKHIAPYSKYPVTNLLTDSYNVGKDGAPELNLWWQKSNANKSKMVFTLASHSYTPVYSPDRNYIFKEGYLTQIYPKSDKDVIFMKPGFKNSVYINRSSKDRDALAAEIDNASTPAPVVPISGGTYPAQVKSLVGYFRRPFLSVEEFHTVPQTIKMALSYYIEDFLTLTCCTNPSQEDIYDATTAFIKTCVNDGVTIEDNMLDIQGISTPNDYVTAAVAKEVKDALREDLKKKPKEETNTSFIPKELEETMLEAQNLEVIKQTSMMIRVLNKKSVKLMEKTSPLSRKLGEVLGAIGQMMEDSIMETVEQSETTEHAIKREQLINALKQ